MTMNVGMVNSGKKVIFKTETLRNSSISMLLRNLSANTRAAGKRLEKTVTIRELSKRSVAGERPD